MSLLPPVAAPPLSFTISPPSPPKPESGIPVSGGAVVASPRPTDGTTLVALGVGIGIGGAIVLVCVGIFVIWYRRRRRRNGLNGFAYASQGPKDDSFCGPQHKWQEPAPLPTSNIARAMQKCTSLQGLSNSHLSSVDGSTPPLPSFGSSLNSEKLVPPSASDTSSSFTKTTFTYEELAFATDDFSGFNLLGQGGFGYVHKGVLCDGKQVAIKQLKVGSGQGEREFQAEVGTITRVHHKHLVELVGHCISGSQRLLVYEYVPNGTLEFHLHGWIIMSVPLLVEAEIAFPFAPSEIYEMVLGPNITIVIGCSSCIAPSSSSPLNSHQREQHSGKGNPPMKWESRMKIALGSAKGLAYLHEDCKPKIIHRDIKSSNILLDENFEAKVADFGLARFYSDTDTHVSTRVMGTFGYLAPEYALTGKLTDKSDVFSFGVVLLELITGRRPIDKSQHYLDDNIIDWARPLLTQALEDRNFDIVADPRLQKDYNPIEMSQIVACASVCVRHLARRRPKMSQIIRALEGSLPLDDLNYGTRPGPGSVQDSHCSSDYDASYDSTQYKEDLRKFRKLAFESIEHNPSECSGPTSDFGPQPSGSSSETLRGTQQTQH